MIRLIFIDDRSGLIPEGTDAYRYREGLFSEGGILIVSSSLGRARQDWFWMRLTAMSSRRTVFRSLPGKPMRSSGASR